MSLVLSVGCDDSSGKAPDGGARSDARGTGGTGGLRDAGGAHADHEGGIPLPTTPIGKACTQDEDCPNGMCATTLGSRSGTMGAPAPGGYCTVSCAMPAECGEGNACVGARFGLGQCALGCKGTSDCRTGYRCVPVMIGRVIADGGTAGDIVTATCQPTPETDELADGVVGSACTVDADCGDGSCTLSERITGTPFPDGYCTGRCVEDTDCGAHGLCTSGFLGAIGSCALRCDSDADCGRDGYRCRVSADVGRCVPGPEPLPDNVVGDACASDDDCGGGPMTCASALYKADAPFGYCSQACAVDGDCGKDGTCISGLNGIVLSVGLCFKSCVSPDDCRDGYTCRSTSGVSGSVPAVCAPDQPSDDAGAP